MRIPKPDYTVSALEADKLWAVTYVFVQPNDESKYADTWHLRAKGIEQAMCEVDEWCASQIDSGEWVQYEIVSIQVIRGCE